jgi:hypothetical protein
MKVKVKLSLCLTKHHTMKTLGSGGVAPRILDLSTKREVSDQRHVPAALP